MFEGVVGAHSDVVKQTEPHGFVAFRVVPGRARHWLGVLRAALSDQRARVSLRAIPTGGGGPRPGRGVLAGGARDAAARSRLGIQPGGALEEQSNSSGVA